MVHDEGLPKLFEKRSAKDTMTRLIEYIQTCVKDDKGIGKPIFIDFYAPLNEQSPSSCIQYDSQMKAMSENLMLLELEKYEEYCYK